MSMWTDSIRHAIGQLEAEMHKVRYDSDLSAEGKEKRLAALKARKAAARAEALKDLENGWAGIRFDYKTLREREEKERAEESKRWDFNRLGYEAQRALNKIGATPHVVGIAELGIDKIAEQYTDVSRSGDRHIWRAWAENAPDLLRSKFETDQDQRGKAFELARRMEGDFQKLTTTPGLEKLRSDFERLIQRADDTEQASNQARNFYEEPGALMWSYGNDDYSKLMTGITLTRKVIPESLGIETTLTVED